ncbi:MAG: hypothetical protein QME62_12445 [Armatimonadota bacterium]|nr:hypothetical protein [Armatimonadota bacterium]
MKEGICATCSKHHTCTYATTSQIVIECDEYEGEVNGNTVKTPQNYIPYQVFANSEEGLCATCGIRETCTYKEGHAVVTQCEDFC